MGEVSVDRVDLERVYDALLNSMDLGSGFLSTADMASLTRVGVALDADKLPRCPGWAEGGWYCGLVAGHAGRHREPEVFPVRPVLVELSDVDDT